jgi:putative inorganic carbon (HCO3(-)) transporter
LAYLTLISVAFLVGVTWAIIPSYILDQNLGIHADRARGPFLQAVANGVSLSFLGLIAIDTLRSRRLPKPLTILLLAALPVAILATKTRSVWLSFAGVLLLLLFSKAREIRRACLRLLMAALIGVVAFTCWSQSAIADRLEDRSPVEFRLSMYEAGFEMFTERPLLGWGFNRMRDELGKRISDFHQEAFYFHNTYLEVLVEHGLLGLFLYVWMIFDLFRLGRRRLKLFWREFPDQAFRSIWPLMLAVYFVNATFVGMNYQFVNVLLFTVAGLLAAQNRVEDELIDAQ